MHGLQITLTLELSDFWIDFSNLEYLQHGGVVLCSVQRRHRIPPGIRTGKSDPCSDVWLSHITPTELAVAVEGDVKGVSSFRSPANCRILSTHPPSTPISTPSAAYISNVLSPSSTVSSVFNLTPHSYHGAHMHSHGRTGSPGCLALARWAGWSAVQVGRHVKCWSKLNNLHR